MNRDELRMRGPEFPPAWRYSTEQNVGWVAPIDSDAGGTWMGVNQFGLAACLLNAYFPGEDPVEAVRSGERSRGTIIPEIMHLASFHEVAEWVSGEFDPEPYANFMLLVVTRDQSGLFLWRGQRPIEQTVFDEDWTMLTSSLIDTEKVHAWRAERFSEWMANGKVGADTMPSFHLLRESGREGWSPLMVRPHSVTRSITQVRVDAAKAVMRYWPDPSPSVDPAKPAAEVILDTLPRRGERDAGPRAKTAISKPTS